MAILHKKWYDLSYSNISWIFVLASVNDPKLFAGMSSKSVNRTGLPCHKKAKRLNLWFKNIAVPYIFHKE